MLTSTSEYLYILFDGIPLYIYWILFITLIVTSVFTMLVMGGSKGKGIILKLAFAEYVYLLLCSTIIYRPVKVNVGHNYIPFWSYFELGVAPISTFLEIIMNIVVFIPLGFLLGLAFKNTHWWQVLYFGVSTSLSIEVLQYFTKRGFSEFDDVFHNTMGCMIGFGIYKLFAKSFYSHCKC